MVKRSTGLVHRPCEHDIVHTEFAVSIYIPPAHTQCAVSAIPLSMCYLDDQVDQGNRPVSTMQIVVIWVCLGCT